MYKSFWPSGLGCASLTTGPRIDPRYSSRSRFLFSTPLYSPAHSNLKHVQAPRVPIRSPSGHTTPRPRLLITRSHPGRAEDRTWEGHPRDTPPNQPTLGRQWARATRTAALGVLKCSPFLVSALKHAAPPPWLQCNHFHLHSRTFYRRKVSATPYPPYLGQGDGG